MKREDFMKTMSSPHEELCTNVVIGEKRYLVLTEDLGSKKHLIATKIYLGGKIISTRNIDYKNILNTSYTEKKLKELMHRQHEMAINMLKTEMTKKEKTPSDYLDEVKTLLQRKDYKNALKLLTAALTRYPDEPFLLSYYGCLETIINKNYTYGIDTCSMAIKILDEKIPFGQEFFYPVFYLNLGRAYLAAGDRKGAIDAFHKGLTFDKENKDLIQEIKKLGIRRKPVIPYLPRLNPINKYIGMILHKLRRISFNKKDS